MIRVLNCPYCATWLPAKNIDFDNFQATCPACDHVFHFDSDGNSKHLKIKPPDYVSVSEKDNVLEIRHRWHEVGSIHFLFWGLIAAFMIRVSDQIALMLKSGPVCLILPLILICLYFLSKLYVKSVLHLNRTRIRLSSDNIVVIHEPVPTFGNRRIDRRAIHQIYVRSESTSDGQTAKYGIFYSRKNDDNETAIIRGLHHYQLAWFIKQEIETCFELEDETFGAYQPSPLEKNAINAVRASMSR